ncbi:MAG: hypothetical protein ACI4R9_00065 [Kiritimatiellia bacterium]
MIYGIMAEKDVKLASVVRAPKEETSPKKVEDRLSRMLSSDGLEAGLHGFIASEGARKVHRDTLIILDPSDVQKPYAKKMEYLARVWDGSKGEVGDNLGFWGCMAVACESGGRRPIPLHFRLWSADSQRSSAGTRRSTTSSREASRAWRSGSTTCRSSTSTPSRTAQTTSSKEAAGGADSTRRRPRGEKRRRSSPSSE